MRPRPTAGDITPTSVLGPEIRPCASPVRFPSKAMKKRLAGFLLAAALAGCGPKHSSFVKVDNVALGRVVVYRNGVAFYEREATVS